MQYMCSWCMLTEEDVQCEMSHEEWLEFWEVHRYEPTLRTSFGWADSDTWQLVCEVRG